MTSIFDETIKPQFRKSDEPSYIMFGTIRDKDPKYNIRSGQLKLTGQDVADLFEPSFRAIVEAISRQRRVASTPITLVFLIGSFAASDWLFEKLRRYFQPLGISFYRTGCHVNKADGAVSFYIDCLHRRQ